jgi:hypothetical protein
MEKTTIKLTQRLDADGLWYFVECNDTLILATKDMDLASSQYYQALDRIKNKNFGIKQTIREETI